MVMAGSRVNRGGFDGPKNVRFWLSALWCGYGPRETGDSEGALNRSPQRSQRQLCSYGASPQFLRQGYKDFAPREHVPFSELCALLFNARLWPCSELF